MRTFLHSTFIGKFLYAFLFVVLVPLLLILWAKSTEQQIPLPLAGSIPLGIILALAGLLIMVTGIVTLMTYGNGLPMNLFPPSRYVSRGIYRLISHPIYVGFSLVCMGTAIALESRSGIWLVTPTVILGCVGLVLGFERPDLVSRFGRSLQKPIIQLPADNERPPRTSERISVYVLVMMPWLILYEAVVALGVPADAIVAYLPFEAKIPVVEWTELFYVSTYLFVSLVPLFGVSARTLREFSIAGLIATGIVVLTFVVLPFIAPPRAFVPHTFLGDLLMLERSYDTPAAAFPAFHVIWAYLAAIAYAKSFPSLRILWWVCVLLISVSCITTGMHALVDVIAGFLVAWMCSRYRRVWETLQSLTEQVANSWKEWHIGPVRIINHGAYGGVGSFLGLMLIGTLLGPGTAGYVLIAAFSILVGAGLWAQLVEGSPSLLRPYGYFGGVAGIVVGVLVVHLLGGDAWLLLAGFTVGGPLIQGVGRLRCLVQGCCHGREAPAHIGIRYTHPRSRVCRLANLESVPIHPTPLYSLLWNIVVGVLMARLWFLHAYPTLIAGLYFVFIGVGRFVEEAYRGEPQTPMVGRLRLYQVMAMISVVSGIVLTTISTDARIPDMQFDWILAAAALGFGFVAWFALGVDFPNSNRRFARLV